MNCSPNYMNKYDDTSDACKYFEGIFLEGRSKVIEVLAIAKRSVKKRVVRINQLRRHLNLIFIIWQCKLGNGIPLFVSTHHHPVRHSMKPPIAPSLHFFHLSINASTSHDKKDTHNKLQNHSLHYYKSSLVDHF